MTISPDEPGPLPERFLALDFGSVTGWATWSAEAGLASGSWNLARLVPVRDRAHPGATQDAFGRQLYRLATTPTPATVVAFEEVYHNTRARGWKAARLLLGWRGLAMAVAYRVGAHTHPIEPTALKMQTLGWVQRRDPHNRRVYARGEDVLARVRAFHPEVVNEHQAVALAVLDATLRERGRASVVLANRRLFLPPRRTVAVAAPGP